MKIQLSFGSLAVIFVCLNPCFCSFPLKIEYGLVQQDGWQSRVLRKGRLVSYYSFSKLFLFSFFFVSFVATKVVQRNYSSINQWMVKELSIVRCCYLFDGCDEKTKTQIIRTWSKLKWTHDILNTYSEIVWMDAGADGAKRSQKGA